MFNTKFVFAASVLSILSVPALAANDCGRVTIADMNWNSASLIANVDRFI